MFAKYLKLVISSMFVCIFVPINGICDTNLTPLTSTHNDQAVPYHERNGDRAVPTHERVGIMNRLRMLYESYGSGGLDQRIKAEIVSHSDSFPIYKFTLGNPKSLNRVAIFSGIHAGTEPLVVVVAMLKLEQVIVRAQNNEDFYMVIYPLLNPWGFLNGSRQNASGVDYNRVLTADTAASFAKDFSQSIHDEKFNIALDLHSGISRKQFFIIRAKEDNGLAERSLAVLPPSLRLISASGQFPDYAEYKRDPKRYYMISPGITQSNLEGTLKTYMLRHADESYSVESPGQLDRETSIKKYLELIQSFEVEAHALNCKKVSDESI